MDILYMHQYFRTPSGSSGTRSYEISKQLVESGHQIHMIAGADYSSEEIKKYLPGNFHYYSTKTNYSNKVSFIKRIFAFLSYMLKSFYIGMKIKNVDTIFATSTPLTIAMPAVLISIIRKKKFVFEVRDLWPDIPVELGFIKNKLLILLLFKFEKFIYNKADHIIVLSSGMKKDIVLKGIEPNKISVVTNFSILNIYDDIKLNKYEIRSRFELPKDKFICIHPGTMGYVNGLDYIIDVAKLTEKRDKDILFLLVGDGNEKGFLKSRVINEDIKNIVFLDPLPKKDVALLTKSADLGLMIVRNKPCLFNNSANKFFDYLAAKLPILINYAGWQKKVLEDNSAGHACDPESPQDMLNKIIEIKYNSNKHDEMKDNAYQLAVNFYSRDIGCQKIEDIIMRI